MFNKKFLIKVSLLLMTVNLLLVGYVFFNRYQTGLEVEKNLLENTKNSEVQGVNSGVPVFDRNLVLSDNAFRSSRSFPNQQAVQNYLNSVNSPLKNFTDQGQSASYWIYASSRGVTSSKWNIKPNINPGVILAFLEKEQSLVTGGGLDNNEILRRTNIAMGYGCPDNQDCDRTYNGFANQVNWAAYQLEFNIALASSNQPNLYKINSTITTLDDYDVFLTNGPTASVYRYTPHVYWGNYNLWKIVTANGWGDSTQTYSMRTLDSTNLPNKGINKRLGEIIPFSKVEGLLKKTYTIGETSEEIKLLQQYLRQQGFFTYPYITGYFGTITQTALNAYLNYKPVNNQCLDLYKKSWSFGQSGDDVKQLQQCLKDEGLFNWPTITGNFGDITNQGLAAVRVKNNISTNPSPTPPPPAPAPVDTCSTLVNQNWILGEISDKVKQLQACLRKEGVFSWPTDTGLFGPVTQKALQDSKAKTTPATPPPAPVATTCEVAKKKNYSIGQRDASVKQLQQCLKDEGLYVWPAGITSYFGPYTQQILAKSLGQVGPANSCANLKTQNWFEGERSERVRQLQTCMQQSGVFNWQFGATGYFGPVTRDSLIKWRGYY